MTSPDLQHRVEQFLYREDRLRPQNGTYRIASRKVILDQSLLPRTITIFL
jgi:3-phenylpropionate/cinnamic acid dioxygenase small subunit